MLDLIVHAPQQIKQRYARPHVPFFVGPALLMTVLRRARLKGSPVHGLCDGPHELDRPILDGLLDRDPVHPFDGPMAIHHLQVRITHHHQPQSPVLFRIQRLAVLFIGDQHLERGQVRDLVARGRIIGHELAVLDLPGRERHAIAVLGGDLHALVIREPTHLVQQGRQQDTLDGVRAHHAPCRGHDARQPLGRGEIANLLHGQSDRRIARDQGQHRLGGFAAAPDQHQQHRQQEQPPSLHPTPFHLAYWLPPSS